MGSKSVCFFPSDGGDICFVLTPVLSATPLNIKKKKKIITITFY